MHDGRVPTGLLSTRRGAAEPQRLVLGSECTRAVAACLPVTGRISTVRRPRLTLALRCLRRGWLRGWLLLLLPLTATAGDGVVTGVVMGPLAAVIGAATVVVVVVVVTVLKMMVTGPHVITAGSGTVKVSCPQGVATGGSLLGAGGAVVVGGIAGTGGTLGGVAAPTPGASGAGGVRPGALGGPPWAEPPTPGGPLPPWLASALAPATGMPLARTPMRAAAAARRLPVDMS
jgi:hypothetical protein